MTVMRCGKGGTGAAEHSVEKEESGTESSQSHSRVERRVRRDAMPVASLAVCAEATPGPHEAATGRREAREASAVMGQSQDPATTRSHFALGWPTAVHAHVHVHAPITYTHAIEHSDL